MTGLNCHFFNDKICHQHTHHPAGGSGSDWRAGIFRPHTATAVAAGFGSASLYRFSSVGQRQAVRWEFVRDGEAFEQAVSSALVLDDPELMLDAAMRGLGLAYALDVFCRAALADGRLLPVLEGWLPRYDGFFLYYPNRQVSAALRALCEVLREG